MNEIVDIKTLAATKSWGRGRVYGDITETIGHTPLVRLAKVAKQGRNGQHDCLAFLASLAVPIVRRSRLF